MIETKFISWNVNGLRACMQKGFIEFANEQKADFICLQETKMQEHQAEVPLDDYKKYFNNTFIKVFCFFLKITKARHNMKLAENKLYNDPVYHYLLC